MGRAWWVAHGPGKDATPPNTLKVMEIDELVPHSSRGSLSDNVSFGSRCVSGDPCQVILLLSQGMEWRGLGWKSIQSDMEVTGLPKSRAMCTMGLSSVVKREDRQEWTAKNVH